VNVQTRISLKKEEATHKKGDVIMASKAAIKIRCPTSYGIYTNTEALLFYHLQNNKK